MERLGARSPGTSNEMEMAYMNTRAHNIVGNIGSYRKDGRFPH